MEFAQLQQQEQQQKQNIVNTVVNANNAFISSLDHLPCEIIRSLWLIQSLNLKNERLKKELDSLLQEHKADSQHQLESKFLRLKMLITRYSNEVVAESNKLNQTIEDHLKFIDNDLKILHDYNELIKMNENPKQRWDMFDSFKRKFVAEHSQEVKEFGRSESIPQQRKRARSESVATSPEKHDKSAMVIKIDLKRFKKEAAPEKQLPSIVIKEPKIVQKRHHHRDKKKEDQAVQEPTYCFCHGPSFGRMVACDNPKCAYQWFHYKCVGLHEDPDPQKKWFCSDKCHDQYWWDITRKKRRKKHERSY